MNAPSPPPPEVLFTGDESRLYGRLWLSPSLREDPERRPEKVILLVHGLGDHGGRFNPLANFIVSEVVDSAVYAFDLSAHGQSPGSPGSIQRYDSMLDEIAAARLTLSNRFGRETPHVLLGHSMGGNLAINYAIRASRFDPDNHPIARLILAAPMLLPPKPLPRPAIFAAWLTGYLLPFWRFNGGFQLEQLTSDPVQLQQIREDSALHSKISMHLATQLVAQGRWAIDHARSVDAPTLILYGEKDELIDRSACDHVAIRMGENAQVVRLPETRHALFHDVERCSLFGQLVDWIKGSHGEVHS